MNTLNCKFCGGVFTAKRNDAIRCSDCRKTYLKERSQTERVKKMRADRYRKLRQAAFDGYGGKCQCCGEDRYEFLALDHVNGGGRKERQTMSTYQIARKVIEANFPPEYRVLCHNCNQAIGWFGYCPHETMVAA